MTPILPRPYEIPNQSSNLFNARFWKDPRGWYISHRRSSTWLATITLLAKDSLAWLRKNNFFVKVNNNCKTCNFKAKSISTCTPRYLTMTLVWVHCKVGMWYPTRRWFLAHPIFSQFRLALDVVQNYNKAPSNCCKFVRVPSTYNTISSAKSEFNISCPFIVIAKTTQAHRLCW